MAMSRSKIDVHAHVLPPTWRAECGKRGMEMPVQWTAQSHVQMMDALDIQKSILSVTAPGTHLDPNDDDLARTLSREANKFMSQVVQDRPDRFGFFATLPLPDVPGAIAEAEYALKELKADGIGLLTNYHGIYLGDPRFEPLFEKLDQLKAKIFVHPTPCRYQPCDKSGFQAVSEPLSGQLPGSVLEYMFDTTRAVVNMLTSGTISRHPNLSFIVPHCGAVIPSTLDRATEFTARALQKPGAVRSEEARELLRTRFYFDVAGWCCSDQLPALLRVTTHDRLLYGSDLPFTPVDVAKELAEDLEAEILRSGRRTALEKLCTQNALAFLGDDRSSKDMQNAT